MAPKTMFEKIWESHIVRHEKGEDPLLYIDLHLVHEVTSAQAFEGMRDAKRKVRRSDLTVLVADHNVPTTGDRSKTVPIEDPISKAQLETLARNAEDFGLEYYDMYSKNQGIVHIIGPEQGWTQPGMVIVCGDSHTATHGAFGSIAMPVGTSQVEHALATQCLVQAQLPTMEIRVNGQLSAGITAKDLILGIIGEIGVQGARGYAVEYTGEAIRALSMDGRMTVCNMTIEAGGRVGMIAPDETTYEYLRGREHVPQGAAFDEAVERWKHLASDPGAKYDAVVVIDATQLEPMVTWGTNPGMTGPVTGRVGNPSDAKTPADRSAVERALTYMGLEADTPIESINIDTVFIGSCTNSRLEDIRAAAEVVKGKKVASSVRAMVVPGSWRVKQQAEAEGLDKVLTDAGFEWREAGCSMCLAMNPDKLAPGERSASTSNRNFEGRQGTGGRTHLVSPAMAAAAAIAGHFVDIRDWK
ncbi:MAG: 3-isopropylmalate dehydratase large subunit [Dehalococcoidia bacterium]